MCESLSRFSQFWYNETIPGHAGIKPAIWIEKTVIHIVSDMQEEGLAAVSEVVYRIFLSLAVLIAALPVALFTLFIGLPCKGIGYLCFFDEPPDEPISPDTSLEDERALLPTNVTIREIPPNGNCAFEAFQIGMESLGVSLNITDSTDFRKKTADWIADHVSTDPELAKLVFESIEEYLEVKLDWLTLEEEQIPINRRFDDRSVERTQRAKERLKAIPAEKALIQEQIKQIKEADEIDLKSPLLVEYLQAIRRDTDTERVYASRAHYYAFSRMFSTPVNIEIYIAQGEGYNLISSIHPPVKTSLTLRFLHKDQNHINILIFS